MTLSPRRRLIAAGVAVAVIAAGAITATKVASRAGSHRAVNPQATTTATVQRTDVAETTPVSGKVAFASPYTIVEPAGTNHEAVTQAQQSAAQAQANLAAEEKALTGTNFKDAQSVLQAQQAWSTARAALVNARSALASAQAAAAAYGPTSKYTALPAVGGVIKPGQSLWSVDGQPVPLLPGTLTPWRAFHAGMADGPDISALDQALVDLGVGGGLTASDTFTGATAAAINRLQASLGVPQTASLALGSALFAPSAVRVTAVHPLLGNTVAGGQPVLDVTSTTAVVNVALPVDQTSRVKVGDPVTVNLPDGTIGEGTITGVGTVATDTTPSNSGSNNTSATVNVTVSLTKASPAGSLDQAPVTVNITSNSAHQVLGVPTTALLAVAGGGYAVEVIEPGGTRQLVGVTTGIFDDRSGMVEVSGSGLAEGQRVVVAA